MAPDIETQALNTTDAAAYIGVAVSTLYLYIKRGILTPFHLPPGRHGTKPIARIRLADLDRFVYAEGVGTQKKLFNPKTIHELPVPLVARLLGISTDGVWMALGNGALKDRSPETIRKYQIRQLSRKAVPWIRDHQGHKAQELEDYLNA
jgi:hypothetical protein